MNIKTNIVIIILLIIISCGSNKQEEANEIISDFYIENHIDSRETIFNVQAISKNGIVILEGETDRADLKENLLYLLTDIKIEDKIKLLPDIKAGENTFGLVNISVANLRSEANHSAELVSQALMGTPVKILKIEDGWLLIQTPDKYISWIDPNGIFTVSASEIEAWRNANRVLFN
ncbi:MAG TPA: SH3 domain-containing protein, partial [Draconibacterium sp.]|nr:SH3 domain-containing protein [Draconibacterium sp.]